MLSAVNILLALPSAPAGPHFKGRFALLQRKSGVRIPQRKVTSD